MRYYLKARGGIWYVHRYDPATGRVCRASTGTRDRGIAEKALARAVLAGDQPERDARDLTVEAVVVRYYLTHGQTRFSPDAIKQTIRHVTEQWPLLPVADLTLGRQEAFVAALRRDGLAVATIRRYLGVVRAALQRAYDRQELNRVPAVLKLEVPRQEGARPFTVDELAALCAAAQLDHERMLLSLLIGTAARPSAVLALTWDRVDLEAGIVHLAEPGRRETTKRRPTVPLPGILVRWLKDQRSLGPVVQWRGKALKRHRMTTDRILWRAGVAGSAYGIRKSVATWLRREDVPEWDVLGLLGHRAGGPVTERYAHYRPEYMRASAESIERLLRRIAPPWLASHWPVPVPRETQVVEVIGGRDRDRTCDPFHVKGDVFAEFQPLRPANDDE